MEKERIDFKKILVGLILFIWFIPLIQQLHPFVELKKLDGGVHYAPDDTLSINKWFDGSYTPKKEKYVNEQFGLRNFFVRSRNSIFVSLLGVPTANGVIIGKNNFLYEEKYIKSYMGVDFIGEETIKNNLKKLQFVSDTLKKLNIDLIFLLAPGKATYYPEYIPNNYFVHSDTMNTNYKWTAKMLKEMNINYIDYNGLFKSMKARSKIPLFPKTGIHWSLYASHYAFDTLITYIENLKHKQLPHFKYNKIEWSEELREPDDDISRGLNTLFKIKPFKMAYPIVEYSDTTNTYRPKVITVSDSYWGGIYYSYVPSRIFYNPEYWYFYTENFDYGPTVVDPITYNLKRKIESADVIILMATEAHVMDMGWGFIEDVYNLYSKGERTFEERRKEVGITRIKRWMKSDDRWTFDLLVNAKKQNISLDSMMTSSAAWLLENDHLFSYADVQKVESTIFEAIQEKIKNNKEYLEQLIKKAKTDNSTVDLLVKKEATLQYENRTTIHLKASNNKFVCADGSKNSIVIADRDAAYTWETFSLLKLSDNKCAIYSYDNKFLSAELNNKAEITATRTNIYNWETFEYIQLDKNHIALKAARTTSI
jgi:hypothetical protein